MKKNQKGFTLVELLVVVAIIGVLSSVILASLNTARAYSRDSQRQAALLEIQQALALYASDNNGAYPAASYTSQCAAWGGYAANNVIPGLVSGGYMPSMPADPAMNVTANQNCIIYISDGVNYKVLDYNMIDSPKPGAVPALVDPKRNIGQTWANTSITCTGATESTPTWAIWSTSTAACAW